MMKQARKQEVGDGGTDMRITFRSKGDTLGCITLLCATTADALEALEVIEKGVYYKIKEVSTRLHNIVYSVHQLNPSHNVFGESLPYSVELFVDVTKKTVDLRGLYHVMEASNASTKPFLGRLNLQNFPLKPLEESEITTLRALPPKFTYLKGVKIYKGGVEWS